MKIKKVTKKTKLNLYASANYINSNAEKELGLKIPLDVYLQDPLVAKEDPKFGFSDEFFIRWEPGISDGPTSARFAIVDYNNDTGDLAPMAKWDEKNNCFTDAEGIKLDEAQADTLQFHQVNVWAVLQNALDYYEQGQGLGRPLPFGFEGNRLIVVPHAGYGKNAFYDRKSKSLQFYYFDKDGKRVYTCLSSDIINHEFGHALLDGIRPYYYESSLVETGAFHEFIGDLTAILIILRDNEFRKRLVELTDGDLAEASHLSNIAEEFGDAVKDQPYLRTARNNYKMSDVKGKGPHYISQVLTGAMFEILEKVSKRYIENRDKTAGQAFSYATQRMQHMAIQPLDLLPPVDVTFKDYALAVLRAEKLSNPLDPYDYIGLMREVFLKREILSNEDLPAIEATQYLYDRLQLKVYHDIDSLSRSRAAAYRFLNDNRDELLIPENQDVIVADLYDANKLARQGRRLPRQIILAYIWREEVLLDDAAFAEHEGESTTMLCGGTLVFDENGNVLSWSRKPGVHGGESKRWQEEIKTGRRRRKTFLDELASRIGSGQIGVALGSSKGLLGSQIPPMAVHKQDGILRFELSPHLHLEGEDHDHYEGGQQWEVSS